VIVGGEAAQAGALRAWRGLEGASRVRWINTYGPTEATVIATAFEPSCDAIAEPIPIGRPIAGARTYVLDARFEPVPVGVPGELYLGGAGVARGYVGQPGPTANRFVPDPYTPEPGARMFQTGDRARWLASGELEFLGRVDHQVKIRGFRVEPGEVEAAIRGLPEVREAAVVAIRDADRGARLVAHVVPAGPDVDAATLRHALRDVLPGPLLPWAFVMVEALPLTSTGKVDRRALMNAVPAGDANPLRVAPRDELETRLAEVWREVLGVAEVGVFDNFFELGGHSLLAIRLLARVEAGFGQALPLATLFQGATIAELARALREPREKPASTVLVPIQPLGSARPFFCVHPAGGIVYCFGELARHLGTDRPFLAFQSPGLDAGEPFPSIDAMASCYVDALLEAQPDGPYHLGGWSLGGVVAHEMARRLASLGREVATLALFDTHAPGARSAAIPAEQRARFAELGRELAALAVDGASTPLGDDPIADAELLAGFAAELAGGFGGDVDRLLEHVRRLDPAQRRVLIFRHFQIDSVYTEEHGAERSARLWGVLRANLLASARHQPQPYPGRVTLFRARASADRGDRAMGWDRWASGVKVIDVPGDHATMLKEPHVNKLANLLRDAIGSGEAGPR
jgi:thioesterase domain-containing protein